MARDDIRFLLGFAPQSIRDVEPTTTVLNWLREQAGLHGTKEGCAEGDCGACTIVLGTKERNRLRYRAVNACIMFVPQLDGAQLITIEHLREENGALHPLQRAFVDHHASQCGFCTPGFIMALFAMDRSRNGMIDRQTVGDGLAGNLCRCTGYRPITEAATTVMQGDRDDIFDRREKRTMAALDALDTSLPLSLGARTKRYEAPRTIERLAELMANEPDAHLLAGGTDVGLWVTKQYQDLATVIDVTRVPDLQRIEETPGHLKLGAAVTYSDAHHAIAMNWPSFGALIQRIGGMQVREAGTIGGNIANGSPIGDTMPALIALDTKLILRKGQQARTLDLEAFYTDYRKTALEGGEFVAEILIPKSPAAFRCYKVAKRFDQDISAVMGAFALERSQDNIVSSIRIGFGGMAALPKRARETEKALLGQPWQASTIQVGLEALAKDFEPISDMRASAAYRLKIARNLLRKFHSETSARDQRISIAI